jgi:hypothetical protein
MFNPSYGAGTGRLRCGDRQAAAEQRLQLREAELIVESRPDEIDLPL